MIVNYNYRLYPTKEQEQRMISVGGTVRFLYNYFLKRNIDQYQIDKKFIWHFDMSKELIHLKKEHVWLNETYSQVLLGPLKNLDVALKNMKKTGAGFPKFKSKYTTPIAFKYFQHVKIIDNKYVRLPKIGDIKIKLHRELPKFTGATIKRNN